MFVQQAHDDAMFHSRSFRLFCCSYESMEPAIGCTSSCIVTEQKPSYLVAGASVMSKCNLDPDIEQSSGQT